MKFLPILFSIPLFLSFYHSDPVKIFIRCNQAGYLPDELKSAVIFSESPIETGKFFILKKGTDKIVFTGEIKKSSNSFGQFPYFYYIDFSAFDKPGQYIIRVSDTDSPQFRISDNVYNAVVDSLMLFFKEQRCGPTDPILHRVCHLWDIAGIEDQTTPRQIDVTGGWHDAGDYLKFVTTTAYTTYLLIFAYDFDNNKFGFDNNNNTVPDILEEAKIGLDWLLRCNYSPDSLITRVQDLKDHSAQWRLPENDLMRFERKGSTYLTKSEAGIYAAALSLGAVVWDKKFRSKTFSEACLKSAKNIYNIKDSLPAEKENDSLMYRDTSYYGEFELAAVELFNATGDSSYLNEAIRYADKAGSDYWWSYGDINSLAHYRLALHNPEYAGYIKKNLNSFSSKMKKSAFNEGTDYSWGTTTTFLGISLQAVLLSDLDESVSVDSLMILPRDFVLGRNLWGFSFIHNIGTNFPIHQHSQVGYFNNGYLPGALSPGPAPSSLYEYYHLILTNIPKNIFNSDSLQFNDDYSDFLSNEPTLTGNATALLVFGYFSKR